LPPPAQERSYYDYYDDTTGGERQPLLAETPTNGLRRASVDNAQPRPPLNTYYQSDCKSRDLTLPHEKYCDHYYQRNGCGAGGSDSQAILRSCPNGLLYTGNGRQGLMGVCDYPHRVDCSAGERHSE
jgi:hypothetical protein